jgi:hypothetical protein
LAIIFIVVLFFLRNKNWFQNTVKYFGVKQETGLTYNANDTVADLINKSTTGDGIPDWEKVLLGLDPTKTENVPGVPDSVTIQKMMQANQGNAQTSTDNASLSQTDKVSREFFATVASLEQSGAIDANGNMDQATQDQLTNSLINNIQNSPQRKIYALSDIKITNDNSVTAVRKYNTILNNLSPTNPTESNVPEILQKFAPDDTGNNTNPAVLSQLTPIITKLAAFESGMIATQVPQSLASLHLDAINSIEAVIENLSDLQEYSTDPIIAFSGMSKYQQDSDTMASNLTSLANAITQKLLKN